MVTKQMTMKGIDTNLSNACDRYIEALDDLKRSKESAEDAAKELIEILKSQRKPSVKHAGVTIYFREGRVTKDKIVVKEE